MRVHLSRFWDKHVTYTQAYPHSTRTVPVTISTGDTGNNLQSCETRQRVVCLCWAPNRDTTAGLPQVSTSRAFAVSLQAMPPLNGERTRVYDGARTRPGRCKQSRRNTRVAKLRPRQDKTFPKCNLGKPYRRLQRSTMGPMPLISSQ